MKCGILSKKTQKYWVWLAYDRDGKQACGVQLGKRNIQTGKKLWEQLRLFEWEQVCTDYYPVYEHIVPSDLHVITKAETWGVESLNSRIRHYLASFRRLFQGPAHGSGHPDALLYA
jgi:insertion element IS1 protein InsB